MISDVRSKTVVYASAGQTSHLMWIMCRYTSSVPPSLTMHMRSVSMHNEPDRPTVAAPIGADVIGRTPRIWYYSRGAGRQREVEGEWHVCRCITLGRRQRAGSCPSFCTAQGQYTCAKIHAYPTTQYVPVHKIAVDETLLVKLHTGTADRKIVQRSRSAKHHLEGVVNRNARAW